jgi:hypothetical protein
MIRLVAVIGILLCTSGCGVLGLAEVKYVHSPNSLPAAGSVFVEGVEGGDGDAAYRWLAMYGYNKAPSSDQAAYVVEISELSAPAYVLYVVMRQQIQGQPATEPPLIEIVADIAWVDRDDPLFPRTPSAAISYLLESAFAIFPGVEGTEKSLSFHKSGDLVCIKTAGGFLSPTIVHCRKADAPPGVLAETPAS